MNRKIELVRNSNTIVESIEKIKSLKKDFLTNLYLDFNKILQWIEDKQLFIVEYNDSIFYIRKQNTFYYLLYISSDTEMLGLDIEDFVRLIECSVIVEIISQKEESDSVLNLFKARNFTSYATLVRLSMKTPENKSYNKDEKIRKATTDDLNFLYDKLHGEFDECSEKLPLLKELEYLIQNGLVLLYEHKDEKAGFLILEIHGVTQHLRYWFVDSNYRNMNVGSTLFYEFLNCGKGTKRQILWCRTDNENALKRYEHYGYRKENLFDYILKLDL